VRAAPLQVDPLSVTRSLRLIAGLLLVATAQAGFAQQQSLPTPEQFFGYRMGADRKLAGWEQLYAYYRKLDAASDRMQMVELGKSSEGRQFVAIFISSPQNLARLEQLRELNARLADPRGLPEAQAHQVVEQARSVIIQTFGLHSTEVASTQTAAEFVYDSIAREDAEAARIRDNVINIVLPSINPDGTQMLADWYSKYVGTKYEGARPPSLYQLYAGHDNNRDGFALNLVESQHLGKLMYRDWVPQAYMDHHQQGVNGARLVIPPYAEPIRPDADPLVWREMTWFGGHMGTRLEAAGKTGVIGSAVYSGWGHMGFHWITPFHNIAGMLAESAGARLATPIYMHPDQLRGGDAERVARRLVAGAGHRRTAEDRGLVDRRSGGTRSRDAVVGHVLEGRPSGGTGRERGGEGLCDRSRPARSADGAETGQHVRALGRRGATGEGVVRRGRSRLRGRLVRRVDGATQAGAGAMDARPHVLSG
jgi:hypothetical protein